MSVRRITSRRRAKGDLEPVAEQYDLTLAEGEPSALSSLPGEASSADALQEGAASPHSMRAPQFEYLRPGGMYAGITAEEVSRGRSAPPLLEAFSLTHLLEDIPKILAAVSGLQRERESPSLPADGAGLPSMVPVADEMKHRDLGGEDGDTGAGGGM